MLETCVSCDASFLVGTDANNTSLIKAHKYILISRSPVFYAMFCGQLASESGDTIRINDIDELAFKHMLRYINLALKYSAKFVCKLCIISKFI